jgi:hypothetical protein
MVNSPKSTAPRVFISYSWDGADHLKWVHDFAARLRRDGIDAVIDQWQVVLGDQLAHFMERAVRENDFVLIVCTPRYKERMDDRVGGVGYEGDIMTAEVLSQKNHRKFIPVLRDGDRLSAMPSWLSGKFGVDLRGEPYLETEYTRLVDTLRGQGPQMPPLEPVSSQDRDASGKVATPSAQDPRAAQDADPIRITGVVADQVSSPRNDGTRCSALYTVPFQLSRRPSHKWSELFVQNWDRPPRFTTMHRPGIARVSDDKVVLDGTTIDEVERYHLATLKLAVDKTNEEAAKWEEDERVRLDRQSEAKRAHKLNVDEVSKRLRFD